ncbi:MAG: hypothetical protein JNL57_08385 [Bacteroidetes bacterium]|nr:hypothetical protein [Bacteroidota bacterium]
MLDTLPAKGLKQKHFPLYQNGKTGYFHFEHGLFVPVRFDASELLIPPGYTIEYDGNLLYSEMDYGKYCDWNFKVKSGGKWGLYAALDTTKNLPCVYDSIVVADEEYIRLYKGKKWVQFHQSRRQIEKVETEPRYTAELPPINPPVSWDEGNQRLKARLGKRNGSGTGDPYGRPGAGPGHVRHTGSAGKPGRTAPAEEMVGDPGPIAISRDDRANIYKTNLYVERVKQSLKDNHFSDSFSFARKLNENLAVVSRKWDYKTGVYRLSPPALIVPAMFNNIGFIQGTEQILCSRNVKQGTEMKVFDTTGAAFTPFFRKYYWSSGVSAVLRKTVFTAVSGDKMGLLDSAYRILIPFENDSIKPAGLFTVKIWKGNRTWFYNIHTSINYETEPDSRVLSETKNGVIVLENDRKYYLYSKEKAHKKIRCKNLSVTPKSADTILVQKGKNWGFFNLKTGKWSKKEFDNIQPVIANSLWNYNEGKKGDSVPLPYFTYTEKGRTGLMNGAGRVMIAPEYDRIHAYSLRNTSYGEPTMDGVEMVRTQSTFHAWKKGTFDVYAPEQNGPVLVNQKAYVQQDRGEYWNKIMDRWYRSDQGYSLISWPGPEIEIREMDTFVLPKSIDNPNPKFYFTGKRGKYNILHIPQTGRDTFRLDTLSFQSYSPGVAGTWLIANEGRRGLISKYGMVLIPLNYSNITAIKTDVKSGYYEAGDWALYNYTYIVESDGKKGYAVLDRFRGMKIHAPEWEAVTPGMNGLIWVHENGKWGIIKP